MTLGRVPLRDTACLSRCMCRNGCAVRARAKVWLEDPPSLPPATRARAHARAHTHSNIEAHACTGADARKHERSRSSVRRRAARVRSLLRVYATPRNTRVLRRAAWLSAHRGSPRGHHGAARHARTHSATVTISPPLTSCVMCDTDTCASESCSALNWFFATRATNAVFPTAVWPMTMTVRARSADSCSSSNSMLDGGGPAWPRREMKQNIVAKGICMGRWVGGVVGWWGARADDRRAG